MQTFLLILGANCVSRAAALALSALFAYRTVMRFARFASGAACGMLLAISCSHLIPEALEHGLSEEGLGATLLISFVLFIVADKLLSNYAGHLHGIPRVKRRAALLGGQLAYEKPESHGVGSLFSISIGTSLHNAIDGIVVASAFMDSTLSGALVTLAIFAHEVPQLTGVFVLLEQTGASRRHAVLAMAFAACWAVAGGIAGFAFLSAVESAVGYALCVSAASFIYVVFAVFVPDMLHRERSKSLTDFAALITGIAFSICILAPLHGFID
ncbi:MAG TPA: hypothetical protein DCW60_01745 [Sutterella sp.]|nr:hypothetical protein [Sutterella sp.]